MLKQVSGCALLNVFLLNKWRWWITGCKIIFPSLQGLQVVRSPRSTSVTRRAAGLPMLILCVVSAEEASKARPLLAHSMQTLLETAKTPLPENWDQTLDLPQVCGRSHENEASGL